MELAVAPIDDLWPGSRRVVCRPDGAEILVLVTEDGVSALANECPHYGAALDRGRLSRNYISCPWHDWQIDIRTGECFGIRAKAATYETVVRDGVLYVCAS